jgi:hypothetical protein
LPCPAALLAKRDRGRGADLLNAPSLYGVQAVSQRVAGAELLEQALAHGSDDSGSDDSGSDDSGSDDSGSDDSGDEGAGTGSEDESVEVASSGSGDGDGDGGGSSSAAEEAQAEREEAEEEEVDEWLQEKGLQGQEMAATVGKEAKVARDEVVVASRGGDDGAGPSSSGDKRGVPGGNNSHTAALPNLEGCASHQRAPQPGSLGDLKRQLGAAVARKQNVADSSNAAAALGPTSVSSLEPSLPIEMQRFLTDDDFMRIRCASCRASGGIKWSAGLPRQPRCLAAIPLASVCYPTPSHVSVLPSAGS